MLDVMKKLNMKQYSINENDLGFLERELWDRALKIS